MPILHLVVATTITLFAPQECPDWRACQDLAVAAASQEDYEAFHDLAWRAVQKGPKNDPSLMVLLARAQSLSGRPGDALVMLGRLADLGVTTDAATNPDFRRVRVLVGWPDLERRIAAIGTSAAPPPASVATSGSLAPTAPATPPKVRVSDVAPPTAPSSSPPSLPAAPAPGESAEALRFPAAGLTPGSLAYDAVSRRFLIADRNARKLAVVDEFSQHVATLAGAQAAFGDIEAMEIDPRAGDLWVVSSEPAAAGGATTLHKLQLVSGRVLSTFTVPPPLAPAHFVDVSVAAGGTILVLDASGRILRLKGRALELAAPAPPGGSSLAATDNGVVYVTTGAALARVDLSTRTVSAVVPLEGEDLAGLSHLRWHRGSLVAVQRRDAGARIIRLRLGRAGRAVTTLQVIGPVEGTAGAFALSGDALYYYAAKAGGEAVLKKVSLTQPADKRP